jgi:carbon-monoxide dehydrogenase medium subunit
MIPPPFEYHAPRSLPDALKLLATLGDDAKVLAGGHSLLPMMKLRMAQPAHLIDINRVPEMRGIREVAGSIRIGAMTVENDLIASALLQQKVPLLVEAARQIADPQVRNRGTIGGDIAHGDPANDHPAIALALGATFVVAGPGGEREIPADEFFKGLFETALAPGELLKEIVVVPFAASTGSAYCKLKRKTGDWAAAAAAVVVRLAGNQVAEVRIALTNAGPTALRATAAEDALRGRAVDAATIDAAAAAVAAVCDPAADLRGDVKYKIAMSVEMTRRAIRLAVDRARL